MSDWVMVRYNSVDVRDIEGLVKELHARLIRLTRALERNDLSRHVRASIAGEHLGIAAALNTLHRYGAYSARCPDCGEQLELGKAVTKTGDLPSQQRGV